jgi:hypothetical protein
MALWERTEDDKLKVTKEGIFPLERLGAFLEEMRSGRGIG